MSPHCSPRGDGLEVGRRHFDMQVEVALVPEVDDGAVGANEVGAFDFTDRRVVVGVRLGTNDVLRPYEEGGDFFDRGVVWREADAGRALLDRRDRGGRWSA